MSERNHKTELGAEGVPYNSAAAEQLVAARLAELGADGKPADRLRVLGELVREGRVATSDPAGRPSTEAGMSPGTARAIKLAEQGGSREPQHNQQRWEWVRHHHRQAATHHAIAQEHEERAKLLEGDDA